MFERFFGTSFSVSHSCTINLSPAVSEISRKGDDSKLSDNNDGRKRRDPYSARADWLIDRVCQSNLSVMVSVSTRKRTIQCGARDQRNSGTLSVGLCACLCVSQCLRSLCT